MAIRPLSADLQQTACELLFEKPERIPDDLEAIKTWIKQQPHLRPRMEDQLLVSFLRGCKYSLEKTKSKLDKFYTMRSKFPELFRCTDVDEPGLRELFREGVLLSLPTPLNENGPRIWMLRSGAVAANKYSVELFSHLASAFQQIALAEDDHAIIKGVIVIMDMNGASLAHFMQWTPAMMRKSTVYSEEALPLRPKAQHFINMFSGFDTFFNMVKPLLPKKQQDRIFIHASNLDKFYQEVPQKYLPKEYGGENGSIPEIIAAGEKKFDEYRERFQDEVNYGTDESLRQGRPINFEQMFGMEGSFRKLDVD